MWIASISLALLPFTLASVERPTIGPTSAAESAASRPHLPMGAPILMEVNGNLVGFQTFYDDGTWEVEVEGNVVAWGTYVMNASGDSFDYLNASSDGGGSQYGTFTWIEELGVWRRTYSSFPNAPDIDLIP